MSVEDSQAKETIGGKKADESFAKPAGYGGPIRLNYYNLFWIFIVCSVVGLLLETIVSTPINGRLEDRTGLLWGPFSPIYGIGGVLMTVTLNHIRGKNLLLIFVVAAIVGASFEFFSGWLLENVFGIVAWSYYDQAFSFGGHTSLTLAVVWGLIGLFWIKFVLFWVMKLIEAVPRRMGIVFTAIMTVFMVVNIVMTLLSFDCWFNRQAGLPVAGPVQEFFAEHYDDEFMGDKFQTMSMYTVLTFRDGA